MKKTFYKTFSKDIKRNFARFIAIIAIVALGVGFLIGLLSATPDLQISVDQYYDEQNMQDIQLKSTVGFDPSTIEQLQNEMPEIEDISGYYQIDGIANYGLHELTTRKVITDFSSSINQLVLKEGRMPVAAGECVVQRFSAFEKNVALGSFIHFDGMPYEIVGVCESTVYFYRITEPSNAGSGKLDAIFYANSDFEEETAITDVVMTMSGMKELNSFSKKYLTLAETYVDKIEAKSQAYLSHRKETIRMEMYNQIYPNVRQAAEEQIRAQLSAFVSEPMLSQMVEQKLIEMESVLISSTSELVTEQLEAMDFQWYVLDRTSNMSYVSFKANAQKVNDVAVVFPFFFFFIAALIALTSITRMVTEDRSSIGTLKSLGYGRGTILSKYLFYSFTACFIGCAFAVFIGVFFLPAIIYQAYDILFYLPPAVYGWNAVIILASALSMGLTILLVTLYVCLKTLKERPNALLIPRAPQSGKRIFLEKMGFFWKHLKFKYKSSLRNVFRFKRNLIMMIVGVGGCTALILVAFGIKDSLGSFSQSQYDKVLTYDILLDVGEEMDLKPLFKDSTYTQLQILEGYPTENREIKTKVFYADEHISEYIDLQVKEFKSDSVVISKQIATMLNLKKGSMIEMNVSGTVLSYKVSAIFDNYIDNYLVVHKSQKDNYQGNSFLIKLGIEDKLKEEEILTALYQNDSVTKVESKTQIRSSFDSMSQSIGIIIIAIIGFSGALAMIVIYNLTNININERSKEIATLKVIGYQRTEVCGYLYREILFMSILGILFGFILGPLLNYFIMQRVSSIGQYFSPSLAWYNFLFAFGITLVFTVLVLLLFIPKVKKIKMVESLKCVD